MKVIKLWVCLENTGVAQTSPKRAATTAFTIYQKYLFDAFPANTESRVKILNISSISVSFKRAPGWFFASSGYGNKCFYYLNILFYNV